MNILYLGPYSPLIKYLRSQDNDVTATESPLTDRYQMLGYDCIVSYGYRHKIPMSAVNAVRGKAINLHISYLPYNRGVNPNYWSWKEHTPKGISIHYIDGGFDTGDIILRKRIYFDVSPPRTLRNTYERLKAEIESMFVEAWPVVFTLPAIPQYGRSTTHYSHEAMELPNGWDTRCEDISRGKQEMRFALDILWEKYGEDPFWLEESTPIVAEYLNVTPGEANRAILDSMVGGNIVVIGSSNTIKRCLCNGDIPHTHYDGNLQFKFYLPIWDPKTPRGAPQ